MSLTDKHLIKSLFITLLIMCFYISTLQTEEAIKFSQITGIDIETNRLLNINSNSAEFTYVEFWASWCVKCIESFPYLVELQNRYKANHFKVIAINVDEEKQNAIKFLESIETNFPILYDPMGKIARKLKVNGVPTAFLLNKQGEIIFKHIGFDKNYSKNLSKTIKSSFTNKKWKGD